MKSYFDIVGDGGSRVLDQVAAKRERIAAALSGVRFAVAIGSGKGGVGKSTLTMQLAQSLTRRGQRCAVLDADINGPSQARMGGVRETAFVPGEHGMLLPRNEAGIGVVSLGSVVPEGESIEFDSVSSGDSHTWRATREFTAFGDLLAGVEWGELDFLLIDLPPGAERTFQYAEFLGEKTAFVLVTIPSDLARGVVARSIASLGRTPNRLLGYVENMSGYWCADCAETKPLFAARPTVELGPTCLGRIPFDPQLAAACDRGVELPAAGASPVLQAVDDVAAQIAAALENPS